MLLGALHSDFILSYSVNGCSLIDWPKMKKMIVDLYGWMLGTHVYNILLFYME